MALSHCWGTCRNFLTKREIISDRRAGFEIMDLPATFRDAVTATRALDIPYLRIDRSKMADAYSQMLRFALRPQTQMTTQRVSSKRGRNNQFWLSTLLSQYRQ
ncbi:hypothetical protein M3J09_013289 [Ascochyta lentis]